MNWLADLLQQLRAFTPLEAMAVLLAIAYLVLAIRQNIWCWFCAGVSTACYVSLFIDARLYMEAALNAFYFGMAVYGYLSWRGGGPRAAGLPVSVWPWKRHGMALLVIAALSLGSGRLLQLYSDAVYPYVDSLTTWAAVWATFLVARKVLENWWYWLVIDIASVVIYWSRDLTLTAVLFFVYVLLIPLGLVHWTRSYRRQAAL
jgi:nicotinamide mononucleotide transporter